MKIAITGTHSTGKSTLAKRISDAFNIPYVRGDKAKDLVEKNFPNKNVNELAAVDQWRLQQLMFDSFDDAFRHTGDCVTDGFHLTCIPYGLKYTGGIITQFDGYSEFVQSVLQRSKQFDVIFYLPPEIALENDNFRPQDQALRMDIDRTLFSLLQDFEYRTLSGTNEARLREAGEEIGKVDPLWNNYVVFEGLPRSGKSTQITSLIMKAKQLGKKLYLCERNDNEYMVAFKNRRRNNWYDQSREMLYLHAEAIKSDYQANHIEDRLGEGYLVIADRQKFTTMTLFGALGVPRHQLYEAVYDLPDAGRTIYLDVNPVLSVMRSMQTEPEKVLKTDLSFQERVRSLYLAFAKDHRFEIIAPNQTPTQISSSVEQKLFGEAQ